MPLVLRSLPYFEENTELSAPGVLAAARAFQIIVWVSVTPVEQFELTSTARRFPAILDTGLNDHFAISPIHLRAWANLDWRQLPQDGVERFYGSIPIPTRRASLWLHPNQYALRDWIDPLLPAFQIELNEGITVYGNGEQVGRDPKSSTLPAPRLPLLGLRALTENNGSLHIDARNRRVSLAFPDA
jgi:hypothetical protein